MRVAVVAEVFLPKVDGVVHRALNLVRQLHRAGDDVLIVCPQAAGCDAVPMPVVGVRSFPFPLYPEYRIGLPDGEVVRRVAEFRPDVLHYVNPFAFGFRCCDLFRRARLRLPTVFSFHTLYGEFVKQYQVLRPLSSLLWWIMREYHNRADVNLTVSPVTQQELAKRGFRRVRVWPPAVDSRLFHPERRSAAMRARLSGGRPERPLLLTVSRLAPEKNVEFLAGVLDRVPGACLAVVGDGPHRGELERRFAGRDAQFLGYLKGAPLAEAYASADAFVYASEMETMGNVVLEAMACGCPVVAPRAGGIPSLVSEGETGLLYTPGDVAEASRLTRSVLDDELVRQRLGRSARDAVADWTWERAAEGVRECYREAVREFRPGEGRLTLSPRLAQAATSALVFGFKGLSRERKPGELPAAPDAAAVTRADVLPGVEAPTAATAEGVEVSAA
jgi:glycosyltransferase involved in cell wall biosynthesis